MHINTIVPLKYVSVYRSNHCLASMSDENTMVYNYDCDLHGCWDVTKALARLSSPCEGIHLFSKLAQEEILGGVGEKQNNVHLSRPQLHQVAHVCDIRQLCDLHKILPGSSAGESNSEEVTSLTCHE